VNGAVILWMAATPVNVGTVAFDPRVSLLPDSWPSRRGNGPVLARFPRPCPRRMDRRRHASGAAQSGALEQSPWWAGTELHAPGCQAAPPGLWITS
jgi:hypothetical protein